MENLFLDDLKVIQPSFSMDTLPKFNFMNPNSGKVTIINENDLPVKNTLKWLNISRGLPILGNCNGEEARARSEMMRFLQKNQSMLNIITRLKEASLNVFSDNQGKFRDHYDPIREHNPFWQAYHELLAYLEARSSQLPDRLKTFYKALLAAKSLEADEKTTAEKIGDILHRAALLEGCLEANFYVGLSSSSEKEKKSYQASDIRINAVHVHGYRNFSFAFSNARKRELPKWLRFKGNLRSWLFFWNIGLLVRAIFGIMNHGSRQAAFRTVLINKAPEVMTDVRKWIEKLISENSELSEELIKLQKIKFLIYFNYCQNSEDGDNGSLNVQIIGAEAGDVYAERDFQFSFARHKGYPEKWISAIEAARSMVSGHIKEFYRRERSFEIANIVSRHLSDTMRGISIDAENTEKVHRWAGLSNLYVNNKFKPMIQAMEGFAGFARSHINDILAMYSILSKFETRANEISTMICFPDILGNGNNVIESDVLYPIHLGINHNSSDIKPIKGIPPINGVVVGLSGKNNTAKTTTELAIGLNIWLGMTFGICFGVGVRFNPKTHIGLALLKDANGTEKGSTAHCHSGKFANILDSIENVPGENVLVIIDEIESATNAQEGAYVGMGLLTCVHKKQASLVFTSQEEDLYREAEKKLGAKNYRISVGASGERNVSPGIKTGGYVEIAEKNGLLRHFKKVGYLKN